MVDSLNLLGVSAVPITMFIDEAGVIRAIRPRLEDVEAFVEQKGEISTGTETLEIARPDLAQLGKAAHQGTPEALRTYGDAVALWEESSKLTQAIEAYQQVLEKESNHGPTHFRWELSIVSDTTPVPDRRRTSSRR